MKEKTVPDTRCAEEGAECRHEHQRHSHEHAHTCGHEHSHDCDHTHAHHRHSSGCAGEECGCGHDHGEKSPKELWRLGLAFLLFLAALLVKKPLLLHHVLAIAALLVAGIPTFLESVAHIRKGKVFDECFLMSVATVGALLIGEVLEGAAVMIFYGVGEYVQGLAVSRSTRAVESLLELCPDTARKQTENGWTEVTAEELSAGDIIRVLPGERIPADGVVTEGSAAVDASSMTGESVPVAAREGVAVYSGCIAVDGELRIRVTAPQKESYAAKMMTMVKEAKETKAPTETFIHRVARVYTPIVVFAALVLAILPPLFTGNWLQWIHRALLFLVASCPCALVLSVPLGFFAGLGNASRHGIFLKGTTHLEQLAKCRTMAFDKTGTLTEGILSVDRVCPTEGLSPEKLLEIAASVEALSAHPIAKALRKRQAPAFEVTDYREHAGSGVSASYRENTFRIGSRAYLAEEGVDCPAADGTALYVSVNRHYAGYITFRDSLKEESKEAIRALKERGIDCTVLSGDVRGVVCRIAEELGVSYDAELMPHEKLRRVKELPSPSAFVGDGINDSPALAAADVGIAMGAGGRDAAVDAADVVISRDSVLPIVDAVDIARVTMRTVWINIIFALSVKVLVMVLGALGIASMAWAVFADVGVCLLAVLHSLLPVFRK